MRRNNKSMSKENSKESLDTKKMPKKRNGRKRTRPDSHQLKEEDVKNSGNDPAWYAADPALLRDAASFPFSYPTGATETHDRTLYDAAHVVPYAQVPGICSILLTPGVGFNLRATDPINVASQAVYSFVRHANSGHSNYDAPDLMMYILGMANNYSFLVWCQRLYGYALTYDQRNRYIPNELIRLNNVDPDSLRNNLANFRFWINTLIAKMSSFAVPATFSVFSRMSFLYSDYYIEGTSIKDQLYQYIPEGFYKFGLDSDQRGRLEYQKFDRSSLMSIEDVMTYGNQLFGSIWEQEDFGIMSGDILKAYGDRIIKLTAIPEAYSIAPKFDPAVLTQMKNGLILDADVDYIYQDPNGLIIQVLAPRNYTTADKHFGGGTNLDDGEVTFCTQNRLRYLKDWKTLTIDTDNPTPELVMEASRLMYSYDAYLGEIKLGTEYIRRVIVTVGVGEDVAFDQLNYVQIFRNKGDEAMAKASQYIRHFHYIPRIFFCCQVTDTESENVEWFDLDNFTVLDNTDLAKLHTAAVINMYAVPSIGKVQ